MENWQTKVVEERDLLKDKTRKLSSFILDDPKYLELTIENQNLLKSQYDAMCTYLDILEIRVSKF